MKRPAIYGLIFVIAFVSSLTMMAEDRKAGVLLQEGRTKETIDGDLKGAIVLYEQAAKEAGGNRALAAQALLRLGVAYKNRGDVKAQAVFSRVAHEYSDQKDVAAEARRRLTTMGGSRAAAPSGAAYMDSPELVERQLWQDNQTDASGRVSSDGRYLSFVDRSAEGSLAVRDLVRSTNRIVGSARGGVVDSSVISRDSKRVAYAWRSKPESNGELHIVGMDGLQDRLVFSNSDVEHIQPMDWTPDGKKILALLSTKGGDSQIAMIDAGGGPIIQKLKTFLVRKAPENLFLSPDGHVIAYNFPQDENPLDRDILLLDADGGFRETVAFRDSGDHIVLGWIDKRLLFASDNGGSFGIWAIETVDGKVSGTSLLVKENVGTIHPLGVSSTGSLLYRSGAREIRVVQNLLPELARLQFAAVQQAQVSQPQVMGTASIEGLVVKLGTNEPISGADLELTRLEGTAAAPLTPGAAAAFAAAFLNPPAEVTPPPMLAPEVQYAKTGENGKYFFGNLKPGTYRLAAAVVGGAYTPTEYRARDPLGRGLNFPLVDRQVMRDVRMEMAPTGTLAGRVLDADGEPMSQVLVMALQEQYVEGRRVLKLMQAIPTDDRGDYRFFSTPPGRYYLAARVSDFRFEARGSQVLAGRMAGSELASEPYVIRTNLPNGEVLEETYRLVYFDGALNPETAKFIDLLPGANLAGMNISVGIGKTAVHHIRGLLINNTTGQPAAGRRVLAVPREPSPNLLVAAGSTDERGVFDLSGVIPGRYVLVSNWPGTGDPSTRVVGMMTFVEVGNTDLENVRIFGAVPLYLPGLVIVETGPQGGDALDLTKIRIGLTRDPDTLGLPPLPPAATVSSVVGVPAIGEVGRDGAFTLQMSPGDYRVTVTGIPANTYIKSIRMGNTDVLRGGFHHDGAAENRLEIVIGADAGELRGIALNEKREPMSNVVVSLVPDLPAASQRLDLYKSTTTDVTGRFQIPTIAPGDYRLFVWEYVEPGAWQNPQFLQPYEVFGKSIHIDAGSKQETQSLVIPSRQY